MLRSEVDTPGLLTIYKRILDGKAVKDDETNPLISVLRLSGIRHREIATTAAAIGKLMKNAQRHDAC